jgi:DNA-binding winged helix-turn-helix (wHTH) protein/tRNA A-37 threonylcarbamoyl transferase component Bud32
MKIRIPEQSFQILVMLLQHPGEAVLRDEIRNKLWPNDTIVEFDHSINAAIKKLRSALGESAQEPRYVEMLARRGYRFLGAVEFGQADQSPTPTPETSGLIGKTISHYRVLERSGGGDTGVVYRAEDNKLVRQLALKLLREDLAQDPVLLTRFEREARATSALNHPNICTISEVEEWAGQPVIAMELLEGAPLDAAAIQSFAMTELLNLSIQIADALDAAHAKGIIHRDLKPSNIFITACGQAKLLDFGVAKLAQDQSEGSLTESGAMVGAPAYNVSRAGAWPGTGRALGSVQLRGSAL